MGDLLALFRCISCRFNFSADPAQPESMGAPGRVFLAGEPELACNVQLYPRTAYLRRAEAEQCRVQSSMLLPVFQVRVSGSISSNAASPYGLDAAVASSGGESAGGFGKGDVLGVLEVVQTSDDMDFIPVAQLLGIVLRKCDLATSTIEEVRSHLPTSATNLQLPLRTGLLEPVSGPVIGSDDAASSGEMPSPGGGCPQVSGSKRRRSTEHGPIHAMPAVVHEGSHEGQDNNDKIEKNNEGEADDDRGEDAGNQVLSDCSRGTSDHELDINSRKLHVANPKTGSGKPGAQLSLEDLKGQFGVGLKDAAAALGVCTTTLKRACRRHGIQRWPRRALQKVAKALDEIERRGAMNTHADSMQGNVYQHGGNVDPFASAALFAPLLPHSAPGTVDFRWSTLASMIPMPPHDYNNNNNNDNTINIPEQGECFGGARAAPGTGAIPGHAFSAWQRPYNPSDASEGSLPDGVVALTGGSAQAAIRGAGGAAVGTNVQGDVHRPRNAMAPGPGASVASGMSLWGSGTTAAAFQTMQHMHRVQHNEDAGGHGPNQTADGGNGRPASRKTMLPSTSLEGGNGNVKEGQAKQALLALSEGPALSLGPGFSLPSFNPSMVQGLSFGSFGMFGDLGAPRAGAPPDDVGLLDSTILELMLSEDSRGLVGATDSDLQRLFGAAQGAKYSHADGPGRSK